MLVFPFAILLRTTGCVLRVTPPFNKRVVPLSSLERSSREWYRCGGHRLYQTRAFPPCGCHCCQSSLSALRYWLCTFPLSIYRLCPYGKTEGRSCQEGDQRHRSSHILFSSPLFSSRHVQECNQEAIHFYKGCGFITKEHIDNYYKRLHCTAAYKMVYTI